MTIRPVDLNGMIQRTDDIGYLKHNEDTKPVMDQQNIQVQVDKREDELFHAVQDSSASDRTKNDQDAKEGSKNSYFFNGTKRKKKKAGSDGTVTKKNASGGFDIKI